MSGGIPHYNKGPEPDRREEAPPGPPPTPAGPVQYDPQNPDWVPPSQRPRLPRRPFFDRSGSWALVGTILLFVAGGMSQSTNPDTVNWSYVVGGFASFCLLIVAIATGVRIGIWESEDEDVRRS